MFYKFSQASSKLQATEARAAYGPQSFGQTASAVSEPLHIPPYKPSGSSMIDRSATKIKHFQRIFQEGNLPVHLKGGRRNLLIYRGAMIGSCVGLGLTYYAIYRMATGQMKKKEQ